jgi:hypothetical protein
MRDLNSRPSRCKRVALPTELIAHMFILLLQNYFVTGKTAKRYELANGFLPTELIALVETLYSFFSI